MISHVIFVATFHFDVCKTTSFNLSVSEDTYDNKLLLLYDMLTSIKLGLIKSVPIRTLSLVSILRDMTNKTEPTDQTKQ